VLVVYFFVCIFELSNLSRSNLFCHCRR
jgi:hypothetical protein